MKIKQELFLEIINSLNMSKEDINYLIKKILLDTQYKIFKLRYTENFEIRYHLRDISDMLNISYQSISETLIRAQTKIIKYLQKNKIIEFNYENISKKDQLINSIKLLERLPYTQELKFNDKSDQRGYFNFLKRKASEIMEKKSDTLTEKEKQILSEYQEIDKVLKSFNYSIKLTDHTIELIKTINELKRQPKKYMDDMTPERTFKDGTNQRSHYEILSKKRKKILDKKTPLTRQDKEDLYNYIIIKMELMKYKNAIRNILSKEEKKKQFIDYINKYHKLPLLCSTEEDAYFTDKTHKRIYYIYLKNKTKSLLELNRPLTNDEQQIVDDYNEIINEWNKYRHCVTDEEKNKKLVIYINKFHTLPDPFIDSTDKVNYRNYYGILLKAKKRVTYKENNNITITSYEHEQIQSYNLITNVRSFHPRKKKENKDLMKKLCDAINIDLDKNKQLLKKSFSEVYVKICFLLENNIPLMDNNGNINNIMFLSDINMQNTYNISLDEIINKYINGKYNAQDSINSIKKYIKEK